MNTLIYRKKREAAWNAEKGAIAVGGGFAGHDTPGCDAEYAYRNLRLDNILNGLIEGGLLMPGDTVAFAISALTPIPSMETARRYGLRTEFIDAMPRISNGKLELFIPRDEMEILADKRVRMLLIIKSEGAIDLPLSPITEGYLREIARGGNPELMVIDENLNTAKSELTVASLPGHRQTLIFNLAAIGNEVEDGRNGNTVFANVI